MPELSPIIRFRIDRGIARRAHQMARAEGMALPDVLRMMLIKAVRDRSFSISLADLEQPAEERERQDLFEPRYWDPLRKMLDAELAIALQRQAIADASSRWGEARSTGTEHEETQFNQERQEALRLLADHDVADTAATEGILKRAADIEAFARTLLDTRSSPTRATRRRSVAEQDRFMAQCCLADLTAGVSPSDQPAAMVVLGQPGAGVKFTAALLGREMRRRTGSAVALSMERIRSYGNGFNAASAQRWLGRAVDAVRERRQHVILEDEVEDPARIHRFVSRLRKDGYVVQVVAVGVRPMETRLALAARYALWRQHWLEAEFVFAARHDKALIDLRAVLGDFEENGGVDGMRVIARDGRQLFENRMAGDNWLRPPRAVAVLEKEQSRVFPVKDAVHLAMRWETLSRALVHDPAVPREVASQVLEWRREAVEQCEASAAGARSLQWAYEGAAFRELDRFAFEAAFPHHARATALMGQAVIEAEKQDAAEAERFLRATRENIAQRIERGDMARIAERAAAQVKRRTQA